MCLGKLLEAFGMGTNLFQSLLNLRIDYEMDFIGYTILKQIGPDTHITLLDQTIGFYAKFSVCIQILRCVGLHGGQHIKKLILLNIVF